MAWGSCYTPEFRVASIVGASTGTTAVANRRLVETLTGAPSFVLDAIDTGRYSLRCSLNAAAQYVELASMVSAGRYRGLLARIKVTALTTNCSLFFLTASTLNQSIALRVNASTGVLAYSFDGETTWTNSGTSIAAGTVYRFEMFVDWNTGSTTHTLKVRLDGVEVINVTGGTASVSASGNPRFGSQSTSASMVVDYADMVTYNDVAEYATVDDWRVIGLEPVSLGTSSFTDNDFQDAASANITAANIAGKNVWGYIDDAPTAAPSTTDHFKQVVTRTTSYIECVLRTVGAGYGDPKLVCLAAAMHPVAAATANSCQFRLRALNADGTTSTEAVVDTSIASNTLEYRKHHYPTRPVTGAAWVNADVTSTALRIRFGYSGDASPPPALDSIMAFVLIPVLGNQTVSPPVATSSSSSLVPVPGLKISPAVTTASASAPAPKAPSISPAATTASASSPTAVPKVGITVPLATASANGPPPLVNVGQNVAPPAATASSSSPTPTLKLQVLPAAATASASSLVPDVTSGAANQTVSPPAAAASASSLVPALTVDVSRHPPAATAATSSGYTPGPNDIVSTSFESESAVGDIFTGGADAVVSFSTANPHTATRHIRAALTASADSKINFPASVQQFAARFWFYIDAWPTSNSRLFTIDGPVGVSRIAIGTTGLVSANIGGTASSSSQATLGAYNSIDVYFDGTTSTFDFRIKINDGVERQVTKAAQTPGDIVDIDFFSTWVGTSNFDLDDLHIGKLASSYPFADMATGAVTIPDVVLTVPPAAATASASSLVPTVTGGVADQTVSPPVATATSSGLVPVPQLRVLSVLATASASSLIPVPALSIAVPVATATASSLVSVPQLRVLPPVATATASALTVTVTTGLVVPLATASANSPPAQPKLAVLATLATASASALVPTVSATTLVSPPAAAANASAPVPVPQLKISPAVTTASASALVPIVTSAPVVSPPAATASASALVPTPQVRVSPAAATASASGLTPVPQLRVNIPTKGSIVLGYSNQLLVGTAAQDAERLIGRTFNGLRQNQNISVTGWSFATGEYALGRRLTYRSVEINTGTWADVTSGTHDTELLDIASNLVATGLWSPSNPAYICFHHEATLSSNSVFGNGQDYINAYRHVVDLWDTNGYTVTKKDGTANGGPIVMVLVHFQRAFTNTLELGGTETPPANLSHADFDPDGGTSPAPSGTTYYSGIGIDGYNSITSPGHLKYGTTASNLFAGMVAQGVATGKFTFIGEFGCDDGTTTTDHTNKADWLDSCRAYFKTLVGTEQQLRALLLTIKSSAENFNVDSSPEATAAFKRLALDPDFYPAYATGFGFNPTLPISVPAATASASALVPTVTGSSTVSPPAATSSTSALTPVPQLRVLPPAATAAASAIAPTVSVNMQVSPPASTASASAPVPTIQVRALPPVATASASALVPIVGTNPVVSPPSGTATASAPVPVPQLRISPAVATASASALTPVVSANPIVLPPVATATASALVPTIQIGITPPAATAAASAPVPVPQDKVLPPVSSSAASALAPTIQASVSPAVTTASASAPVPTLQVRVIVPAATASASAFVPTPDGGGNKLVSVPVATASATALIPVVAVGVTISPPVTTASAFAPAPGVVMKQWPQHTGTQWPPDFNLQWPALMNAQWAAILGLQWPPDSDDQWE